MVFIFIQGYTPEIKLYLFKIHLHLESYTL